MTLWLWKHKKRQISLPQIILLLFSYSVIGVYGKSQLCEVETGQTNIILDIEESRGDYIGQKTSPPELPINGDPTDEISLAVVFPKGNPIFSLKDKTLQLLQPLDRDKDNLSHIVFQISCTIRATGRNRNIPIIVRVSDVNDNAPIFINTPYETSVAESTPIGTTIFRNIQAQDKDAGVNGLVEYFLVEGSKNTSEIKTDTLTAADGFGTFAIAYPHQGQVTVVKTLDYERIQRYYLTIVASDRARNSSERLSATTTLTVNIGDSDDLDPSFIYRGCVLLDGACINPEYKASVPAGTLQGVLDIAPERIQAIDLDTISSSIKYSFLSGTPSNFRDYFEINEQTGIVKQTKVVDSFVTAREFDIIVKAEEVSESKRFTTAKLTINVKPVDLYPPVISASSTEGFVDENSPVGTRVTDSAGNPIKLSTKDADIPEDVDQPMYSYELTTPSFIVSSDGVLLVNEAGLDRDPPNPGKFMFQIVAREINGNAASTPLSITVYLNDVNDNAPKLPTIPPVTITAGDGRRLITKVIATDNDEGKNAVVSYSIIHVSNNGVKKFAIDKNTGEIETRGRLVAGEQYSITVQASDVGNLHSQVIVEVNVIPGPNTKPPSFAKSVYDVQVSEGAEINSTVIVVKAEDPEGDPVKYSIVSGNDLRQFYIGQESGVLTVIRKLDREELSRYQLIIKADDNGGLSSTATVNIKVTDINDKNPEFDESILPFVFSVDEGQADIRVGVVHATDGDEGVNAKITYSIPNDIPFMVDSQSGEIRTKTKLDYEKQKEFKFVVTAKDGAEDARLGTASVTVSVKDIQDELPKFVETELEVKVPENVPDKPVAIVQAVDPDTEPEITYKFRKAPTDLFRINAMTGEIFTTKGLDYEAEKSYNLIIGTMENNGNDIGDAVKVHVIVEDRNDIPPVFVSIPEPVTISDDQGIGTVIGSMPAIDADGTAPGNVVRYEIVGRGKALKYFQIDTDNGDIRIRDDLRKEDDTEYQVDVRAYDLGEPQLSSVASLPIYVKHVLTDPMFEATDSKMDSGIANPEAVGLAFSDDSYTTTVSESTGLNAVIKLIQIINSKKANKNKGGLKCEIVSGNEMELFETSIEDHACGLKLVRSLDYENITTHELGIKLTSTKYFVNPQKSFATIKIIVQDDNDNAPQFDFQKTLKNKDRNNTYYGVVSLDADVDTIVLHVKATDKDSGKFGTIKYRIHDEESNLLYNDDPPSNYFTISEDNGVIKTQKPLHKGVESPLVFLVEARDNNGEESEDTLKVFARVVVNVITDVNRMALVFSDTNPKEVRRYTRALEDLLHERTDGLMTGIEKLSNRRILDENGTIFELTNATDVWFYAIDPKTEKILERNSSEVISKILKPDAQTQINLAASVLAHATVQGIHAPVYSRQQIQKVKAANVIDDEVFPFALIAVAIVIVILGMVGIVYICVSWSKYKNFKQRMRQYTAPSSNPVRYDPVIIGNPNSDAATNLKEYETQVLAMAVNTDEGEDLHIDFSAKNHAFSLDNVSYITHKEGQHSPANSDATTAVMGTLQRNNNINLMNNINNKQNTLNKSIEMNRNYMNSFESGTLPGTLTLGRIKSDRNNIINGYGDTLNRNNLTLAQNNTFSTLGRRPQHNHNVNNQINFTNDLIINNNTQNTLNRNRYTDLPITNPLYNRQNSELLNISTSNDNVIFGKRGEYTHLGFSYYNDIDRSDETTTEL